ncbi:MAG TPA: DUF2330 domain-containing protein, partial [Gemmataceae bacterium]|nr:DUF2330 domain-containing protein [Gemmataceae bacterium]
MIRAVPLLLLACALALTPDRVEGCAAIGPDGGRVDISAETALVVWDEATKTQHFIRRGSFQSTNYDFGFLVPTPTRPELDVADERVFEPFASLTAPKTETRTSYDFPFGCGGGAANTASDASAGGVMVVEQKKVGDYDAAVLGFKGDDAQTGAVEVRRWLEAHGYPSPPWLDAWLTPYVQQKWLVTAFKIGKRKSEADPKDP